MNWVLLAAISFTTFGLFCAFDAVAALESYLTKDLNLNSVEFGLLFTLYSLPNIVLVLFGGVLIDKYGTRFCGVLYSVLACVGASIVAISSQSGSYSGLLLGRFLFGMGAESFYVVQNYMLVEHFRNDNLATAMGISGSISRLGSLVSWTLLPQIATSSTYSSAFWAAALFCFFSLCCMFAYVSLAGKPAVNKNKKSSASFSLKGFPLRYWLWIAIAVSFYAAIVTFRAMGSKCISMKWGYSSAEAASFLSVIDMASLICSPIWGFVVDKFSFKNRILVIAAGNALAFMAYFMFGQTTMDPIYVVTMLGIVMSIVPPTVWPLISVLVDPSQGGIATAIVAALLNGAIASCIPVAGSLVDTSISMFAGFLQLIAGVSVFTSLYWYVNTTAEKKDK